VTTPVVSRIKQTGGLWFQALFVLGAILCAAASVFALARTSPIAPVPQGVQFLLIANTVILAVLAFMVVGRYLKIRKSGIDEGGGRLTRRFMLLFGIVAMIPAIIVSVFLWLTITRGIDTWLGDRVLTLVDEIETLTEENGEEFAANFENDASLMAVDVNNAVEGYENDRERFESYLGIQAFVRNIAAAYVIDRTGFPQAVAENMGSSEYYARPTDDMFDEAELGTIVTLLKRDAGYTSALLKLDEIEGTFLYLAKPIDATLFGRLDRARTAQNDYRIAQQRSRKIQTLFVVAYLQIVALALLLSVRMAQEIAGRISGPITTLAIAANEVSQGQRNVKVPLPNSDDEVLALSNSFNEMTRQLDERREDLISAREESEERRRFLETLLGELSSGVIRLDEAGVVTLANRSAENLLNHGALDGLSIADVSAQIAGNVRELDSSIKPVEVALNLDTSEGIRHVRLKIASETAGGHVLTLDDATRLISAQRQLAWRDVARRIAHEIRNPLTPIQLSTERLRRRYADKIDDTDGVFERCINTILRQVSDIGRMVQEFSDFARMPKPTPEPFNLSELLQDVTFAQRVVNPEYKYVLNIPKDDINMMGDERLLGQAITNIVKNASEAISERPQSEEVQGQISISVTTMESDDVSLTIQDNGPGFPETVKDRLLEPYVTAKEGGTGLGLAIVNRVIMDHGGSIHLSSREDGQSGALVKVTLPKRLETPPPEEMLPEEYSI
jgi:two-component system nitrogen regulation sensor histidine kinase NtrY